MTAEHPQPQPREPIPQLTTREEEAQLWDTHDFADYWDEFRARRRCWSAFPT